MKTTEEILTERETTHGSFADHAHMTQGLKEFMEMYGKNYIQNKLTSEMKESLEMIAHKIGRILSGDPFVQDHWDDIAGYAKLVSKTVAKDSLAEALDNSELCEETNDICSK